MTVKSLLSAYAGYNLWANKEITQWLSQYPEEWLYRETPSSFSTIHTTILHIWDAEYVWLSRLRNEPLSAFPNKVFQGGREKLFREWLDYSADFLQEVLDSSEEELEQIRTYQAYGKTEQLSGIFMIQTCMNHGSYHRGQIITMGRMLDMSNPPKTDFIQYCRENLS